MSVLINKRWMLLQILLAKTQQGKIRWETAPTEGVYANVGNLGISLTLAGQDYVVSFYNENGDITEVISDVDFSSEGFENAFPIMKNLYDLAWADATGSEKVIDNLLDILKDI